MSRHFLPPAGIGNHLVMPCVQSLQVLCQLWVPVEQLLHLANLSCLVASTSEAEEQVDLKQKASTVAALQELDETDLREWKTDKHMNQLMG